MCWVLLSVLEGVLVRSPLSVLFQFFRRAEEKAKAEADKAKAEKREKKAAAAAKKK